MPVHYLDVGGGFPAVYQDDNPPELGEYFNAIYDAFDQSRLRRDCVLMCEPGAAWLPAAARCWRRFSCARITSCISMTASTRACRSTLLGKMKLPTRLINPARSIASECQDFTILGPTCDNLDILPAPFHLPVDADEGDWIEIGQTGAYTNSAATRRFNGTFRQTFVLGRGSAAAAAAGRRLGYTLQQRVGQTLNVAGY